MCSPVPERPIRRPRPDDRPGPRSGAPCNPRDRRRVAPGSVCVTGGSRQALVIESLAMAVRAGRRHRPQGRSMARRCLSRRSRRVRRTSRFHLANSRRSCLRVQGAPFTAGDRFPACPHWRNPAVRKRSPSRRHHAGSRYRVRCRSSSAFGRRLRPLSVPLASDLSVDEAVQGGPARAGGGALKRRTCQLCAPDGLAAARHRSTSAHGNQRSPFVQAQPRRRSYYARHRRRDGRAGHDCRE